MHSLQEKSQNKSVRKKGPFQWKIQFSHSQNLNLREDLMPSEVELSFLGSFLPRFVWHYANASLNDTWESTIPNLLGPNRLLLQYSDWDRSLFDFTTWTFFLIPAWFGRRSHQRPSSPRFAFPHGLFHATRDTHSNIDLLQLDQGHFRGWRQRYQMGQHLSWNRRRRRRWGRICQPIFSIRICLIIMYILF